MTDGGVLAMGEAKLGATITRAHLERLRRIRTCLGDRAVPGCRLVCFSGLGFSADLIADATSHDVVLVDLDRLYGGA